METALERFSHDRGFLCELLSEFIAQKEKNMNEFGRLMEEKDRTGLKQLAHSLKGSSANLSCENMYHLFTEVEEGLAQDNWEGIIQAVARLSTEYSRVAEFMKTI